MPHQHCPDFPDIAHKKPRVNNEQKDKIVRNILNFLHVGRTAWLEDKFTSQPE